MTAPPYAQPVTRLSPKWRDRAILLVALVAGSALTLLAGRSLQQAEVLRMKERQNTAAQTVVIAFERALSRTTEAVRNAGLMIEANPQLTHAQFNRYMQDMVENQLSVNLMEWQPIVPANKLAQFEAAARTAGQPNYRVVQPDASGTGWEPVRGRDEYVPVLFCWPEKYRTEGLDMSFSPGRMASKLQSRAVGQPVASGVLEFMKEGMVKSGSKAVAISTTVFGADHAAKGYLAAVVDLSTLFQPATSLADAAKFDLLVFASDTPEAAPIYTWYGDGSDLKQMTTGLRMATFNDPSAAVDFARQSWKLVVHPRPAFYAEAQENSSRIAFVAGAGMTLLIAMILFRLQVGHRNIERAESVSRGALLEQKVLSQQLQEAQRIAHVGSWQLDVATNQLVWSEQLYRMWGMNPDLPPPDFTEYPKLFAPASWERLNTALTRTVEAGVPYELELEMVKPDGSHGWMLARGEATRDESGSIVGAQGVAVDITERKQAEETLRESDERWKFAIEGSGDGVWDWNLQSGEATFSKRWKEMLGFAENEIENRSEEWVKRVHPEDVPGVMSKIQEHLDGKTATAIVEFRMLAKDGSWKWILGRGIVVRRDAEGKPLRLVGTNTDLTDRKRMEDELRASEGRLRSQFDGAIDGILILKPTGELVAVNESFARMHGYTREELLALTLKDLDTPETFLLAPKRIQRILAGESTTFEVEHYHKDGDVFPLEVSAGLIADAHGEPLIQAFHRNIAERTRLEAQLRESQKMEALGTLAGGVAHDFNNALAAILGNAELARQDVGPDHAALVSLEEIGKASRRAKDLVQQILTFGRRQQIERKPTSLALVVVETARLLRATLPAGVSLNVDCRPDAPAVLADATQIKQVLLNLCANALHAVENQVRLGVVEICLSAYSEESETYAGSERRSKGERIALSEGRYACLSVSDNGSGMDEATRSRVFEPFFTTRPVGKGTGLGLSVVHGIAKAHDASVEVESTYGAGSTFRIYFPAVDAPVEEADAATPLNSSVQGKGKHVVYLDDEEAIVFLMKRLLERQGFRVSGYTDPREALEAVQSNPAQFDLVVTDYNMPYLSGLEVASALKEIRPDLPVVLASGYITEELRAKAPVAGISELIYKPNTVDDLCQAIVRYANAQDGKEKFS